MNVGNGKKTGKSGGSNQNNQPGHYRNKTQVVKKGAVNISNQNGVNQAGIENYLLNSSGYINQTSVNSPQNNMMMQYPGGKTPANMIVTDSTHAHSDAQGSLANKRLRS